MVLRRLVPATRTTLKISLELLLPDQWRLLWLLSWLFTVLPGVVTGGGYFWSALFLPFRRLSLPMFPTPSYFSGTGLKTPSPFSPQCWLFIRFQVRKRFMFADLFRELRYMDMDSVLVAHPFPILRPNCSRRCSLFFFFVTWFRAPTRARWVAFKMNVYLLELIRFVLIDHFPFRLYLGQL